MRFRAGWLLAATVLPAAGLLIGAALLCLLTVVPMFPRRELMPASENDLRWRDGTIVAQDFSSFPGGYDMEVWWAGDKGRQIRLVDLGDNTSFDYSLDKDRLCVRYRTHVAQTRENDRWRMAVFDAPEAPARLMDISSPFLSGDFREWRFRVEDGKVQRSDLKTSK